MAIDDAPRALAEAEMEGRRTAQTTAIRARYLRGRDRIIVTLANGVELAFPPSLAQGLAGAEPEALRQIEISPSGLGLHWPALDAELSVPGLLGGLFGSPAWMARALGAKGGRVKTAAKAAAARQNGKRGGRPKKQT